MLVLTRKRGESIVIGGNVEVRVISVRGQKVRLAIDAPPNTSVDRKEVQQRRAIAEAWKLYDRQPVLAAIGAR